jgi:colicin import membrane protein
MERFSDKARAFIYAVIVHLACAAFMLVGFFWTSQTVKPLNLQGPVIEATLVGVTAAPPPRAISRPKPPPPKPPEPQPEPPKPEPKPEPPPELHNDAIEQEKISELALQKAEQVKKAEEEKHRQEQVRLDQEKKEKEAADRQKKLEDIRQKREAAEKQRKLEQEKLAQLEDVNKKPVKAPAQPVPVAETAKTGTNGDDTSLLSEYSAAIINVVRLNWNRPDNAQPGLRCTVNVIQLPGGDVMSATAVSPCNADPVTRASIEQAVTKAQPLPYKGYEKVFARQITFIFTYDGN